MKLFYRKYGSGPPLIILHGLFGSSDNWVTIAGKISASFTVYIPDQRNHGQSPHSPDHNYNLLSLDLLEFAEDHKIEKFILAGHSMGGRVAMSFAIKWPEKINSLIVIDISPFNSGVLDAKIYNHHREILETILSINPSELSSRADLEKIIAKRISSEKIRELILKNLQRTDNGSFKWKLNAKALLDNLVNIMDGIRRPAADFPCVTGFPVTFVKGEESDYLQPGELKEIQKIFPTAEIINVKKTGHWIHAERPDIIESILLNQLNN
jgi:esterase